jgi:tetratricopeptide (TPR) repeat protein
MKKNRGKSPQPKQGAAWRSTRGRWLLWLAAIVALTFIVYIPSLDNGFTNWDDNYYVTENPLLVEPSLKALFTIPIAGNYHPLTIWSLALNYQLSGLEPASYHWLSLLLHLANTALVFLFIRKLSGGRFWTTVVTSLYFGIHPMHVESVAWIAERKDVLYSFFFLLALIAYLRYLDSRKLLWIGATLIAFILSSAAKPAAVVLPLTLLAIDYYTRRPINRSVLLEKAPFFAISLAVGLVTLKAQQSAGAIADPHIWTPIQKLLFASYGTLMYFVKLFLPVGLSAVYPYPNLAKDIGSQYYVAFVALAILLPAIVYLCRRERAILFGLAFFFINIVLVLQFFTVGGAVMADRYTYLSYIGLFFALARFLDERPGPAPAGVPVKRLLGASLALLFPLSIVQTWTRCDVWQNAETLWNDTIRKYPRQIVDAYNNRGIYYHEVAKRLDAALLDYDEALALNSKSARVWMNKGMVLAELRRDDSAYVCFQRALELQPGYAEALNNRGGIKMRRGDLAGAVEDFSQAVARNSRFRVAYTNRAHAYFLMQDYERSIADSRRAIELAPNGADNYLQFGSIGMALQELNRHREAIPAYDEAIRAAPSGEPRLWGYYQYRSYSWLALGDRRRALADAQEAARRGAPVDPAYLRQLGG